MMNTRAMKTGTAHAGPVDPTAVAQLPVSKKKKEIIAAIRSNPVVIISGETGSGKTTQIPKFCLEAGLGRSGMIGCTQPRRIAAITVAARIADELGEPLGRSVGYKIRFDDRTEQTVRIKLMTDGILLAEAQKDRHMTRYSAIIVDEAHERSLNIDFTLGLLKNLVRQRKDLKLIITSATIDTEKFSAAFDSAPVIEVSGRMFPVDVRYMPVTGYDSEQEMIDSQAYVEAAADAVRHICSTSRSGDILVFMPTEQDIGDTMALIRGQDLPSAVVLPLFARLSAKEQARVFARTVGRKIIVSTNVAETSLTIPGIRYVVDTGLARIPHYSPRTRTTALPVKAISQSSANQRKGRCGRVENGICIRLYHESDFMGRPFFTSPEILRSNLADVILRMISLKLGDIQDFPFIDRPSAKSITDGFDTLLELGAIKPAAAQAGRKSKKTYTLTRRGRIMARIPVDPKLSRILLEAHEKKCVREVSVIASALSIADPRQRPQDKAQQADQKHARFKDPSSDFITLLNIWDEARAARKQHSSRNRFRQWCADHYLSFKRIREWMDIHRQITGILKEHRLFHDPAELKTGTGNLKSKEYEIGGPAYIAIHQSLLCGYLANIAHKSENNLYAAAKGRKAMIFPGSGLFNSGGRWIVAAEFVRTSQLFARTVANIDPAWIETAGRNLCVSTYSDPHWEKKRGEVMVSEQVTLFGLVIVSRRLRAYGPVNPEEAGEIFIRRALVDGETDIRFRFMAHNRALIEKIEAMEHKTREKDILATEQDIFEFYQARLPEPFYNIRTFQRFLKTRGNDECLCMTPEDLQKKQVDAQTLALFPDTLKQAETEFALSYHFNPGSPTDGITVRVPAASVDSLDVHHTERLVPGLFREKIVALIKALPKSLRRQLVPVSDTAEIIANEMPASAQPLFAQLSQFVHTRFNADIPPTAWSSAPIEDHLKMRIAIVDDSGKEIDVSRESGIIRKYSRPAESDPDSALKAAKKKWERQSVREWDFGDIAPEITIRTASGIPLTLFPGLAVEKEDLALRLFRSKTSAEDSHKKGMVRLYAISFPDDIRALEKDIRAADGLTRHAGLYGGAAVFRQSIHNRLMTHLFAKNIRTRQAFEAHAADTLPLLYRTGQAFIKTLETLCEEVAAAQSLLHNLSLRTAGHARTHALITELDSELTKIVPPNFCDLYSIDRIGVLHRYAAAIRIRAQRACDNLPRDISRAKAVQKYGRYLKQLMDSLTPESSEEKIRAVEDLYWLIQEYKISLFAQEIRTLETVSPKKLDILVSQISRML